MSHIIQVRYRWIRDRIVLYLQTVLALNKCRYCRTRLRQTRLPSPRMSPSRVTFCLADHHCQAVATLNRHEYRSTTILTTSHVYHWHSELRWWTENLSSGRKSLYCLTNRLLYRRFPPRGSMLAFLVFASQCSMTWHSCRGNRGSCSVTDKEVIFGRFLLLQISRNLPVCCHSILFYNNYYYFMYT